MEGFYKKTKALMALNTSPNGDKDQPTLEKPNYSIEALIKSGGAIDCLYEKDYKVSLIACSEAIQSKFWCYCYREQSLG